MLAKQTGKSPFFWCNNPCRRPPRGDSFFFVEFDTLNIKKKKKKRRVFFFKKIKKKIIKKL